jgi:hypothetical protein
VGKAYPYADSSGNFNRDNIQFNSNIQSQNYSENKLGFRSIFNIKLRSKHKLVCGIEMDFLSLKNNRQLNFNDTNYIFRNSDVFNPLQKYQAINSAMINADFKDADLNISSYVQYSF